MAVQAANDQSIGELVQRLSEQTGQSVRQERLAPEQAIETTRRDVDYVRARAAR